MNRGTSQYLGLLSGDGITEDADFVGSVSDLISFSTEIGGLSDESKWASTITDGTAYYVFCRDTQGMVLVSPIPQTAVVQVVTKATAAVGLDSQKWVLENVSGNEYRIKNKATNLYLAEKDGAVIQMTGNDTDNQIWVFGDHYGYKWKVWNKANTKCLNLFGSVDFMENFEGKGYQLMSLSTDLQTTVESITNGGVYYLFTRDSSSDAAAKCVLMGKNVGEAVDKDPGRFCFAR